MKECARPVIQTFEFLDGLPTVLTRATNSDQYNNYEPRCEKTGLQGFRPNQAVKPHKMARGLKFRIEEVEG